MFHSRGTQAPSQRGAQDGNTKTGGRTLRQPSPGVLDSGCASAIAALEALIADNHHCPHFLPRCKAVILCSSVKAGFGLAVERGGGVLLARLPAGAAASRRSSSSKTSLPKSSGSLGGSGSPLIAAAYGAGSNLDSPKLESPKLDSPRAGAGAGSGTPSSTAGGSAWSAPCFVTITGVSAGLTAGAHRATHLIGVMSDAALAGFERHGTLGTLGTEYSVCLLEKDSDCSASYAADVCVCTLTSGLMLDINVQSLSLRVDAHRNERAYGAEVSPSDILRGRIPLPPEAGQLARRLSHADGVAVAAAFEPSHAGSEAAISRW